MEQYVVVANEKGKLMANMRAKGKKMTGAYVWENDLKTLQKIASDNGVTQSDLIRAMIAGLDDMDKKAINKIVESAKKQE